MSFTPSATQRVTQGRLNNVLKSTEQLKLEKKISLDSWKTSDKHVKRFGKEYELLDEIARRDANSLTRGAAMVARDKLKKAEAGLKGAETRIEQVNGRLEAKEKELAELQEIFDSQSPSPPRSKRATPSISPPAVVKPALEVTTTKVEPLSYEEFVARGRPKMVPYKTTRLVPVKKQPKPQQLKRYQGSTQPNPAMATCSGNSTKKQQTTDESDLFAELFGEGPVTDALATEPTCKKRTASDADLEAEPFGGGPATKKRSAAVKSRPTSPSALKQTKPTTPLASPSYSSPDTQCLVDNNPAPQKRSVKITATSNLRSLPRQSTSSVTLSSLFDDDVDVTFPTEDVSVIIDEKLAEMRASSSVVREQVRPIAKHISLAEYFRRRASGLASDADRSGSGSVSTAEQSAQS